LISSSKHNVKKVLLFCAHRSVVRLLFLQLNEPWLKQAVKGIAPPKNLAAAFVSSINYLLNP